MRAWDIPNKQTGIGSPPAAEGRGYLKWYWHRHSTPNKKGFPQSRAYAGKNVAAIPGIGCCSACQRTSSGLFRTIRIGSIICISRKPFEGRLKSEDLDADAKSEHGTAAGLLTCGGSICPFHKQGNRIDSPHTIL